MVHVAIASGAQPLANTHVRKLPAFLAASSLVGLRQSVEHAMSVTPQVVMHFKATAHEDAPWPPRQLERTKGHFPMRHS